MKSYHARKRGAVALNLAVGGQANFDLAVVPYSHQALSRTAPPATNRSPLRVGSIINPH